MRNFKILSLLSFFVLFCSCFEHEDDVTITKSGNIEVVSTINVKSGDSKTEVQEGINTQLIELKKEGWKISYKWIKESKPFKIKFTATNTLNNLYNYQEKTKGENPSGIYIVKKYAANQYALSFDLLMDADNRLINLNKNSIPFYRIDANDDLKKVSNIESKKNYIVILK